MKTPQELFPAFCDWQQGDSEHRALAFLSVSKDPNAQGGREWTICEAAAGNTDLLAAALLDELERGSGPLRPALEIAVRGRALRNPNLNSNNNPRFNRTRMGGRIWLRSWPGCSMHALK